jgi:RND family efflux transporter MFP subunit
MANNRPFLLQLLLIVLAVISGGSLSASAPAADLQTVPAEYVTVTSEEVFDGVIEAVNQSTVAAQTSGRVTDVLFDVDDTVTKGSIIAELRDTEQQARLAKADSGLAEAQARYTEASEERQRQQNLYEGQAGSKAALERAVAAYKAAKAGQEAARARVAEVNEQLEHTVIRAPYDGIVVERHIEVGETVQPGMLLMTGLSLESLRVTTQIPERLIGTVRKYQTARIMLRGEHAGAILADEVTVSPRADKVAHTFEVRIRLPERQTGLYPGMSIKVAIVTGEAQRLLIPARAIVHRSEVAGVYIVNDQGVVFRQVRPGRLYDDAKREILAGLMAGERVALDPAQAAIELKRRYAGQGDE